MKKIGNCLLLKTLVLALTVAMYSYTSGLHAEELSSEEVTTSPDDHPSATWRRYGFLEMSGGLGMRTIAGPDIIDLDAKPTSYSQIPGNNPDSLGLVEGAKTELAARIDVSGGLALIKFLELNFAVGFDFDMAVRNFDYYLSGTYNSSSGETTTRRAQDNYVVSDLLVSFRLNPRALLPIYFSERKNVFAPYIDLGLGLGIVSLAEGVYLETLKDSFSGNSSATSSRKAKGFKAQAFATFAFDWGAGVILDLMGPNQENKMQHGFRLRLGYRMSIRFYDMPYYGGRLLDYSTTTTTKQQTLEVKAIPRVHHFIELGIGWVFRGKSK